MLFMPDVISQATPQKKCRAQKPCPTYLAMTRHSRVCRKPLFFL